MSEQMVLGGDGPSEGFRSVPKRTGRCPECGHVFDVNPRHPEDHRFCSPRCKAAWHRKDKAPGKPTRAQRILARLREGPATGLELLKAGGGTRYGARLKELRDQGYRIETDMGGEWPVYRLEGE